MIKLTDNARDEVLLMMKGSDYQNPALRLNFAGFG